MADTFINLVEYAKGHDDPFLSATVEQFAMSSDVLMALGFQTAPQGKHAFEREASLPGLAFRKLNAEPEHSHGTMSEFLDQTYPLSGLLRYDRIKLNRYGETRRNKEIKGQMKRGAAIWTDTFINGDNTSDPAEWSGMKARLLPTNGGAASTDVDGSNDDSRLLANATASGGGPLSLAQLDIVEELVPGANVCMMNKRLKTLMKKAARDPNLTNNRVTNDMDSQLGRRVLRYGDMAILTGYEAGKSYGLYPFLPFDEVAYGGGAAVTTSIYAARFAEDGVSGIHERPPETPDLGHGDSGIYHGNLFEWDCGMTIEDYYSAIRLSSITNEAIVA